MATQRIPSSAKFFFDLNGYVILRGVLTAAEIASANTAIDKRAAAFCERTDQSIRNTKPGTPLAGDGKRGRMDLGGMLEWQDTDVFRNLLAHPRMVPYLHEFLGLGYRLDHRPLLIAQDSGSEGFSLHGGPVTSSGEFNPHLQYRVRGERIYTTLLAASVALVDTNPGDGGFCVLPGSHKANFATPEDLVEGVGDEFADMVRVPQTKAGDVVLFSEATVHGALPWSSPRQRRLAIYRFSPSTLAYGRSYAPAWPAAVTAGMSAPQLAVLEPPYHPRLDRPVLSDEPAAAAAAAGEGGGGSTVAIGATQTRAAAKKDFDSKVYQTKYF